MADVRVDDRLEHLHDRRSVDGRGRRSFLDEELHQPIDADELRRAAAQDREHRRARDTVGERVRELVDRDLLVVQVALHEVVVTDDDALDQRVVDGVLLHLHLGRDRTFAAGRRCRRCR